MESENILHEMAMCDFSAPLSVKIMYDESDEEISQDLIIVPQDSMNNNTTFTDNIKKETQTIENIIPQKNLNSTHSMISKTNCEEMKTVKYTEKIEKQNKYDHNETTEEIYFSHNVKISYSKNGIDNKKVTKDSIKKQCKKAKNANDYIHDLVLAVSESLLNVIGSYYKLAEKVRQKNYDVLLVEDLKQRYKRIKYHFFQLSYCTIISVILDLQTHQDFSEEFLNSTIKIAKEKRNIIYTSSQLKPFYEEMITWAKMKKEWLQNLEINNIYKADEVDSPTLRQHLAASSKDITKYNNTNTNSQRSELAIPVNHQFCKPYPACSALTHAMPHTSVTNAQNVSRFDPVSKNITNIHYSHPTTRGLNLPYTAHQNMPINNLMYSNNQEINNCNLESNQNLISGLQQQPPYMPPNYYNPPLPTYGETWQWLNGTMVGNQNFRNVPQSVPHNDVPIDTNRSSVSTDSGVMSPLNFNNDNTVVEENSVTTPLITDVTSLNPAAMQIMQGFCCVCKTITKKKCLGCYLNYYCSYECQRSDWRTHMHICKKNKINHVT